MRVWSPTFPKKEPRVFMWIKPRHASKIAETLPVLTRWTFAMWVLEVKQRCFCEKRLKRLVLMNQTCVCASLKTAPRDKQQTYLFETQIPNKARKRRACGTRRADADKISISLKADGRLSESCSSRPVSILSFLSNNYHCFEGLKVRLAEQKASLICSFTLFWRIPLVCWVRLSWFVW